MNFSNPIITPNPITNIIAKNRGKTQTTTPAQGIQALWPPNNWQQQSQQDKQRMIQLESMLDKTMRRHERMRLIYQELVYKNTQNEKLQQTTIQSSLLLTAKLPISKKHPQTSWNIIQHEQQKENNTKYKHQ